MNLIKLFLISVLLGVSSPYMWAQIYVNDTNPLKSPAFENGEFLEYDVSYKIGFLNIDVATVSFETFNSAIKSKDAFHIRAIGKTSTKYTWFYDLHDVYNTHLDKQTLRPIYFENRLQEDKYNFESNYKYDWDSMRVNTIYRNLKNEISSTKSFHLSEISYDAIATFFNLRSVNIDNLQEGIPFQLEVVFHDKVRKILCWFEGNEYPRIRKLKSLSALKFRCQLANSDGQSFNDGSEFTIWISNDKNRIPLYIESPIRIGSIRVRLKNYKNLKYNGILPSKGNML